MYVRDRGGADRRGAGEGRTGGPAVPGPLCGAPPAGAGQPRRDGCGLGQRRRARPDRDGAARTTRPSPDRRAPGTDRRQHPHDDPALAQLRAPNHDADALARVLGAPSIGGFDVELLTDADERAIRRRIAAFFAGRDRDDLLLLHFSGHGVKDAHGRLYLAARDTELSTLSATAVPASFVNDQLAETHSRRVVLILDCCYSGAFARNTVARAGNTVHLTEEFGGGAGRVVLTASSATEYAFEDGALTRDEGRPLGVHHRAGQRTGHRRGGPRRRRRNLHRRVVHLYPPPGPRTRARPDTAEMELRHRGQPDHRPQPPAGRPARGDPR